MALESSPVQAIYMSMQTRNPIHDINKGETFIHIEWNYSSNP